MLQEKSRHIRALFNKREWKIFLGVFIFLLITVCLYFWYLPYVLLFPVFDAEGAIRFFKEDFFRVMQTSWNSSFFRPIASLILYPISVATIENGYISWGLRCFLMSLYGLVFWLLLRKILGLNGIMTTVFFVLLLFSNFSYYIAGEMLNGIMETSALFFAILTIAMLCRASYTKKMRYLWWSIVFYGLAMFSHERYIVFAVPCFIMIIWRTFICERKKITQFFVLSITLSFAPLLYIIHHSLNSFSIFRGAGGVVTTEFDISKISQFYQMGVKYLFGIHPYESNPLTLWGDRYLNGLQFDFVISPVKIATYIAVIIFILINLIYIAVVRKKLEIYISLWCALIVSLIPPSLTFRLELRWCYAPYMLLLTICAFIASCNVWEQLKNSEKIKAFFKYTFQTVIFVFCFVTIVYTVYYHGFTANIYLNEWAHRSQIIYNSLVKPYRGELAGKRLIFYKQNDIIISEMVAHTLFGYIPSNSEFVVFDKIGDVKNEILSSVLPCYIFTYNEDLDQYTEITQQVIIQLGIKD